MSSYTYNDGGRAEAGYMGDTRDCACRAIAIATGKPYKEVYDLINKYGKEERITKRRKSRSNARTGVWQETMRKIMKDLDWKWVATMGIGTGCRVHVKADELPSGNIIVRASRHFIAIKDGVVQDIYDSSRDGTRCVYGYWKNGGHE